ncbi:MAG: histidine--tRNA ligase [Flavobacteriales bacterium]|nr:histidine--tRNA ligase [Flavobacteriales bacterium]
MSQPSIPKGTRDFSPEIMVKRNYIFGIIRQAFERFGYMPLETPSMENVETLTGKYGDEGDKLIFRILDSGDYLKEVGDDTLQTRNLNQLTKSIAEKALRYDLTVPFARYVVMNQNKIAFPFKRYQIQPVWRADRPQKGRYREFYQCDADVVGSDSLLNEVELVQIFDEVLTKLKVPSTIKINNRKILYGIAEVAGIADRMMEMTIAIDKLDKIGEDGVIQELRGREFNDDSINVIKGLFGMTGDNESRLNAISVMLRGSETGQKGVDELKSIFKDVQTLGLNDCEIELDITLARGLNYYTGAIFEVKAKNVQMGSICGGGRYDDLTGIFGLKGVSGVGISFGADRIFDVMSELNVFPSGTDSTTQVLFVNFGKEEELYCMKLLRDIRKAGINAEIFPEAAKMKKQFKYADDKGIPFVATVGTDEMSKGQVSLKNMKTGDQKMISVDDMIEAIKS